jgi:hypothetical protein
VIFQPTSTIDKRLAEIAQDVESQEADLRVVSACAYRVPAARLQVGLLVQSPRRFNVLEEFVLRAASELDPRPTLPELAVLLGLDDLFVQAAYRGLEQIKAIAADNQGRLKLTALGQDFYAQGRAPRPPERKAVSLVYLGATDAVAVGQRLPAAEASDPVLPGFAEAEIESKALAAMTLQRVIDATISAGLGLHLPDEGQVVMAVEQASLEERGYVPYGVLLVQDTPVSGRQADNVSVRTFNLAAGARDLALEQTLDQWLSQGSLKLGELAPDVASLLAETRKRKERKPNL